MNAYFSGEVLILLLLLPVVLRPFFAASGKTDLISVLALIAFLFTVCLVAAAGLSVSVLCTAITSFFVLIINIRAINRFFQQLRIDAYSPALIVASILGFFLIAGTGYILCGNMTVSDIRYVEKVVNADLVREETRRTGSFADGFTEISKWNAPYSAVFYRFYAQNDTLGTPFSVPVDERSVVVFLPDVFASVEENRASINAIAARGNVVVAADFFDSSEPYLHSFLDHKIFRSFALRVMQLRAPELIKNREFSWMQVKLKELEALFLFAASQYPRSRIFCVVADGGAVDAAKQYMRQNPEKIVPVLALDNTIPGYVAGWGNVAVFQNAAYRYVSDVVTDGHVQAQQIAARVEKLK